MVLETVLAKFILPALLPAAADVGRAVVARVSGGKGAMPQNVAERVQLMQAETDRLKALAQLDAPTGQVSPWVADLRASFRYVAVGAVVLATLGAVLVAPEAAGTLVLLDMSGACMSFIIGERMYLGLKK